MVRVFNGVILTAVLLGGCQEPAPVPLVEILGSESGARLPAGLGGATFRARLTFDQGSVYDIEQIRESNQVGPLGEGSIVQDGTDDLMSPIVRPLRPGPLTILLAVVTAEGAVVQTEAEYTVNNPPTAPVVGVDTVEVRTRDVVTATMLAPAEDLDGDPLTYSYTWRRGGVASNFSAPSLPPNTTRRGQIWSVSLIAHDGIQLGPESDTIDIEIVNTPPTSPGVRLVPESPVAGVDDLQCVLDVPSTDDDQDTSTYTVTWTADGLAYPADFPEAAGPTSAELDGDTVPAVDLALASRFTCTLVADDGYGGSAEGSASADVIGG